MPFLKTLIGAVALCAVLLAGAALVIGPDRAVSNGHAPALTAAAVLASDGMAPDGRPGQAAVAGRDPDRLAVGPAARDAWPAG